MKLSLKVEYACRVLAQLSRYHGTGNLAHIEELAEAEAVPANYLVQILNDLRNGGLITSKRGKQGGYALARAPELITLKDVIRVIDADFLDSQPGIAGQSGPQVAKAWGEVSTQLEAALEKVTLQQLMLPAGNMYYI